MQLGITMTEECDSRRSSSKMYVFISSGQLVTFVIQGMILSQSAGLMSIYTALGYQQAKTSIAAGMI